MNTWRGNWLNNGFDQSQITYYVGDFINYKSIAYIATNVVPIGSPPPPEDMGNWDEFVAGMYTTDWGLRNYLILGGEHEASLIEAFLIINLVEYDYSPFDNITKFKANRPYAIQSQVPLPATSWIDDACVWIAKEAFKDNTNLTHVSFPNVKTIGINTFQGATSLSTADFANLTKISDYCFHGCTSLMGGSFSMATEVGEFAFEGCSALSALDDFIFPSLTTIKAAGFRSSGISSINLDTLTTLDTEAFASCSNLTAIYLPNLLTIPASAFVSTGLPFVNDGMFPDVTTIGNGAFSGCPNLVTFQNSTITQISESLLNGCTALQVVNTPLVTSIGQNAFVGCSSLDNVNFPLVTSLSSGAFMGCSSLSNLTLGTMSGLTVIPEYAFKDCTLLDFDGFNFSSVTQINDYAFYNTGVVSIDLSSLTAVGSFAFSNCANLTGLSMPLVTSLPSLSIFDNCPDLTTFSAPLLNYIQQNGSWGGPIFDARMFSGCTSLSTINLPLINILAEEVASDFVNLPDNGTLTIGTDIQQQSVWVNTTEPLFISKGWTINYV